MHPRRRLAIVLLCALSAGAPLQACADGNARRGVSKATMAPTKANGSGISVEYRIDATPQAGRAMPVVLSLGGVTDPAGAAVRLVGDAGLSLGGGAASRTLPAGETTVLTVDVLPPADGIGYLHVFTTQHGATSATSIPVQVGKAPAAMPASSALKQGTNGEKILSMPVK